MSKISNNGKYITLDEVRVYFNEKTQMIEITLKDDDVTSKTPDKNPVRVLASLTTKHGRALYDALEEKQNEQVTSQEEQSSEPKVEYLYPVGPLPALKDFPYIKKPRRYYCTSKTKRLGIS